MCRAVKILVARRRSRQRRPSARPASAHSGTQNASWLRGRPRYSHQTTRTPDTVALRRAGRGHSEHDLAARRSRRQTERYPSLGVVHAAYEATGSVSHAARTSNSTGGESDRRPADPANMSTAVGPSPAATASASTPTRRYRLARSTRRSNPGVVCTIPASTAA